MKNLFIIAEEEKGRIISLHESATKKQYLSENELGEAINPSQGTANVDEVNGTIILNNDVTFEHATKSMGDELKLFKGTKFVRTQKNNLMATKTKYQLVGTLAGGASSAVNTGNVVYYCSNGKFQVQGLNDLYYNEDFLQIKKVFADLCPKLPQIAKQQVQNKASLEAAKQAGWKSVEEWANAGYKPNPNAPKQPQPKIGQAKVQNTKPKTQIASTPSDADLDAFLNS